MVTALSRPSVKMATSMRRLHGVVRTAARATPQRVPLRAPHQATLAFNALAQSTPQSRSFSAHANSQPASPEWATAADEAASPARAPAPQRVQKTDQTQASNRALRNVLFTPESSFAEAQHAFSQLQTRDVRITGRHYAALMEKANVERRYDAVRSLFHEFSAALDAQRVVEYKTPKTTWDYYSSERLQLHRHVLWAMLRGLSSTWRTRRMQRHFRKHELTKSNRIGVYETDALSFLLRMECTFKFAAQSEADDIGDQHETSTTVKPRTVEGDAWLERVKFILSEMRTLRFTASHSSVHALFHFLMHRPDVALAYEAKTDGEETEDKLIQRVLFGLLDEYPRVLNRSPWLVSLAVSTAASAGRIPLAIQLLMDAEKRTISVDAASFAHVVASAKDNETRVEIADLFMRAKDAGRIHESEDNHAMKNYLLLYAIHDGNFTQIMELLHEMEFHKITATARTVTALLVSIATYRSRIRWQLHENEDPRRIPKLERALKACPTVQQLLHTFPTAIQSDQHTCSLAILQALRAGDIEDALKVLRAASSLPLRAEVFSQVLYALLANEAHAKSDVLAVREVEKLYDRQHPGEGKREYLNAQLLNLCESNHDFVTAIAVLDNWQLSTRAPLSKRSAKRVFEVVSKQLKAVQEPTESVMEDDDDDDEAETLGVRYKVGGAELSYRGILERYPVLIPVDAWSVGQALMRSATAALLEDVVTLLQVAQQKNLELEPVVFKAALDVLHTTATKDGGDAAAAEALRVCVAAMKSNGMWSVLAAKYPEFTAGLSQ